METEKGRKIHIVGAGGVGFWLAVGLSRANVGQVFVYDDDNLTGGLGHNRLPLATPATRKVDLLKGFLRVNFGGELPEFVASRFNGTEADKDDLVVDCSDMPGTRRRTMWTRAKKRGARLLRVSYDGANSTVTIAEGLPIVLNEAASGYANVPSLALSLMAGGMGAEVVGRLLANWELPFVEFNISLADWVPGRVEAAA